MNRRAAGFSLLELTIAGAIIALLAAIALPSYRSYVIRNNRAVARGILIDLAAKQELIKLQTQTYASSFGSLVGVAGNGFYINPSGQIRTAAASDSIYRIGLSSDLLSSASCAVSASTGAFALTATPVNGSPQAGDVACASLCLSSAGLRGSSPGEVATCWAR